MVRRTALLALGTGLASARFVRAEPAAHTLRASDLKTVLIGKIAEFVRWPAAAGLDDMNRPFEFSVLGHTPLEDSLAQYYRHSDVRVAGHRVFFRRARDLADVGQPHLLFVGGDMEEQLAALLAQLGQAPVLLVGDSDGFAQRGIAVNLYQVDDRIRFEISRRALQRHGLSASYRLLSRARLIDDQQARR